VSSAADMVKEGTNKRPINDKNTCLLSTLAICCFALLERFGSYSGPVPENLKVNRQRNKNGAYSNVASKSQIQKRSVNERLEVPRRVGVSSQNADPDYL
jgi:hypothetical protein